MVEGTFNAEPASQMSDISAGPQYAVEFSVAAIPSVELQGNGPSIPEAWANYEAIAGIQRLHGRPCDSKRPQRLGQQRVADGDRLGAR